jgi:hypothetical protein
MAVRDALAYCRRPEHVRRTLRIALIVGLVLTAINQLDVILGGAATVGTWIKCGLNFVVPFVVSNLGLLSAGTAARDPTSSAARSGVGAQATARASRYPPWRRRSRPRW